jgi:hypothetical protein
LWQGDEGACEVEDGAAGDGGWGGAQEVRGLQKHVEVGGAEFEAGAAWEDQDFGVVEQGVEVLHPLGLKLAVEVQDVVQLRVVYAVF